MSFDMWFEKEFLNCKLSDLSDPEYWHPRVFYSRKAWDEKQKKIDAVLQHIEDESWVDEYGDCQCPAQRIKEILK